MNTALWNNDAVIGEVVAHSSKRSWFKRYPVIHVRIDDTEYMRLNQIFRGLEMMHDGEFGCPQKMQVGLNGVHKLEDYPIGSKAKLLFSTCSRIVQFFYGRYGRQPFSWEGVQPAKQAALNAA